MRIQDAERKGKRMIYVIYWSQTGNTAEMAKAVGEGISEAGGEAKVLAVGAASPEDVQSAKALALGCPASGSESLEESEMEPFVEQLEKIAGGKSIALFGSYGWGGGEWMHDWESRLKAAGATIVNGKGVICMEAPDEAVLGECRELGKELAKAE